MDQAAAEASSIPHESDEAGVMVVAQAIWQRRRIPAIAILVALLFAIIHLYRSVPLYEATAVLFPSTSTETEARRITPTGAALGILDVTTRGAPTPFDKFFAILKTPAFAVAMDHRLDLAKHLYAAEWDEPNHRWKTPGGLGNWVKRLMGWQVYPFDPIEALTSFFSSSVIVTQPDKKVTLMTVTFAARNREFAQSILAAAVETARQILITQEETQLTHDIDYLTTRLQTVDLVEHRVQLGELLANQEREMMLLKAGSYGADVLQPVYTPNSPRYPNVRITLLLAFGLGLIGGTSIALVMALRENAI